MISNKNNIKNVAKLTRRGYTINIKDITPELLDEIRESLKVSPKTHKDYQKFAQEFYVFSQSPSKIYLPRFWGIENLGPPNITDIKNGKKVENLIFKLKLFDFQKPIVDKIFKDIVNLGGSILSVPCGFGKTCMSLYIACKLKRKTLIIVHTSVLLSQWIERIEQFVPSANIGLIRGNKFDSENKDICIAMLQTLTSHQRIFQKNAFKDFGFLITDETHHLAAPTFSKVLPLVSTKYMLGLSATPYRQDQLEKVFQWYLGNIGFYQKKRSGFLIVKYIKYIEDSFVEKRRWNNSFDLNAMTELIIDSKIRNKFIADKAIQFSRLGRQVLILSARRNHLKLLLKIIHSRKQDKPIAKIISQLFPYHDNIQSNISQFYQQDITAGLYIGQMKPAELKLSSKCNIILGTYSLVSEGTDIPTLNTLIMASPKKSIQQVVGRILRGKTNHTPLVLDICDCFSIYRNQGNARIKYYLMQDYHIDMFDKNENEKIIITNDIQTNGYSKPKRKPRKKKIRTPSPEKKEPTCLLQYSDSDDE